LYKQQRTRKPWTEEQERDSCQHCNTQKMATVFFTFMGPCIVEYMTTVFLLCQMTGQFKDSKLRIP